MESVPLIDVRTAIPPMVAAMPRLLVIEDHRTRAELHAINRS